VKYLNNRLECDHGKMKRLIQPTLGFQSMKTTYATIKGIEIALLLHGWGIWPDEVRPHHLVVLVFQDVAVPDIEAREIE
jgi:transposase-like protein